MVVLDTISPSIPLRQHDVCDVVQRRAIKVGRDLEQQGR